MTVSEVSQREDQAGKPGPSQNDPDEKTMAFLSLDQVPARRDVLMKLAQPCPEWCSLEPDHDADEIGKGDFGRIHRSPEIGDHSLDILMDDGCEVESDRWSWEPDGFGMFAATPRELAAEMRGYAASVTAAAKWLETQG